MTSTAVDSEALSDLLWVHLLRTCTLLWQDSVACVFFLDFAAHHAGYSVSCFPEDHYTVLTISHTLAHFLLMLPSRAGTEASHKVEGGGDLACNVLGMPAGQFGRFLG